MIALLLVGCGDGAPDMGEASTSPVAEETDATTASTPDSTPEPTQAADDEAEEASGPDADPPQDDNYSPEEFFFVVGGVEVIMGQPALPIIDRLGEYQNSFCAQSCAFDGIDWSWFYSGFEVHAFPVDGVDFILSVILKDDVNGTNESVFLGMTYDDMVAAYGNGYEQSLDQFLYRLGCTSLAFIIIDDSIELITYRYEDAPGL